MRVSKSSWPVTKMMGVLLYCGHSRTFLQNANPSNSGIWMSSRINAYSSCSRIRPLTKAGCVSAVVSCLDRSDTEPGFAEELKLHLGGLDRDDLFWEDFDLAEGDRV